MRGEQNNILFPVRISWANNFPNLSPFAPPLGLCSSATPRLNLRRKIILNLKNHATNTNSCTSTKQKRQGRTATAGGWW